MNRLKKRVRKMEEQVAQASHGGVIISFSNADLQRQKIEFYRDSPSGKLIVFRVQFIDPKTGNPVPFEPSKRCNNEHIKA